MTAIKQFFEQHEKPIKIQYPEQFDRIGNLPGVYHIVLKDNAQPKIHASRKCSIHIKDELKTEIDLMEHQGIIRK